MTTTTTLPEPHVADKIEPGAILYSSWGYDQTNIDFYYVVRTTEKSAWIIPMSSEHHDNGEGFSPMSEHVTAGRPLWFTGFCKNCRHHDSRHFEVAGTTKGGCHDGFPMGACECTGFLPAENKPRVHRIQRSTWRGEDEEYEYLRLNSYSSASLWEGRKMYASHYA